MTGTDFSSGKKPPEQFSDRIDFVVGTVDLKDVEKVWCDPIITIARYVAPPLAKLAGVRSPHFSEAFERAVDLAIRTWLQGVGYSHLVRPSLEMLKGIAAHAGALCDLIEQVDGAYQRDGSDLPRYVKMHLWRGYPEPRQRDVLSSALSDLQRLRNAAVTAAEQIASTIAPVSYGTRRGRRRDESYPNLHALVYLLQCAAQDYGGKFTVDCKLRKGTMPLAIDSIRGAFVKTNVAVLGAIGALLPTPDAHPVKKYAKALAEARTPDGRSRTNRRPTPSLVVVPENSIRPDSRGEAESAHHPMRCSRSSIYLERMSPLCSSRGAGLKPRTCFSVISSTLP
jgi:hypothetical protein